MATTIVMTGIDTFEVFRNGQRIARTTAYALSNIDYDIAQTVLKAQEQPGIAVAVPTQAACVSRPRNARMASNLIQ